MKTNVVDSTREAGVQNLRFIKRGNDSDLTTIGFACQDTNLFYMNVLVIGSGAREHAICHSFAKSKEVGRLYCASGNAGIAEIAHCVPIAQENVSALLSFARENETDLTFVGGETPLALGIVDHFERAGRRIIGPTRRAAQLEASKAFAKDFMARNDVPSARFVACDDPESAIKELDRGTFGGPGQPVVVKADGLAAGKGVVVAPDRDGAVSAVRSMAALVGTAAAERIVLEECLVGREISLLMFADGEDFALMPATRDHKRIGEGDTGPNTGGMGAITDASLLSNDEIRMITDTIIRPTLRGCEREGFRFRGILFLGLMMAADGPKLLEYNVRFGDPETQAILVRLETDLVDICEAMFDGSLASCPIEWRECSSACVVLASRGYPVKPQSGDVIDGLELVRNVEIFHAGTAHAGPADRRAPKYVTSGGRVLSITATGDSLDEALAAAYAGVAAISFEGMQYRRDIGR
ncbi:MAG TPA: phosphoribosylamine--glycine ligase [Pyrinomonadaceae bacterium]|nr:phosphoribosylamine--glycine ligase [Pyrinomonadaceae bacterium]